VRRLPRHFVDDRFTTVQFPNDLDRVQMLKVARMAVSMIADGVTSSQDIMKKVAFAWYLLSIRRTGSVKRGSGPSSNVSATAFSLLGTKWTTLDLHSGDVIGFRNRSATMAAIRHKSKQVRNTVTRFMIRLSKTSMRLRVVLCAKWEKSLAPVYPS